MWDESLLSSLYLQTALLTIFPKTSFLSIHMAKMVADSSFLWKAFGISSLSKAYRIMASHSVHDKNKVSKQLGLFSLKKKIEDAVVRAEMLAPAALELEEGRLIKREQMIRDYNLWDDPAKSDEILNKLADSVKVVDALKDVKYKVEEAKLIMQLAEIDAVNSGLFKQAYNISSDVCKFLNEYETSKLLEGPFDLEGACIIIDAGSGGISSEIWAEQLLDMYTKWARKLQYDARIVEKRASKHGGIMSASIEFEFEFAYGYLSGEHGVHYCVRNSLNGSILQETSRACVDIIPLFLQTTREFHIEDKDLMIMTPSMLEKDHNLKESTICIQHIPTGICVRSSGERSQFANKIKALNRLKAKLLVTAREQGVSSVSDIEKGAIDDLWQKETRRYMFHPHKFVHDMKTGIHLPDLNSVLDGNIEPLIAANVSIRQCSND